jgi:AraC-like DNA-binding protein
VRAAPLQGVPALLTDLGVPPGPLLREFGLPDDAFDDGRAWVPFSPVTHLLARAARLTGRDDFGLLAAQRVGASALGPLAQHMMLAPNVGAALQVLRRDFHLHDRGAVPYVADLGPGCVALGYALQWHDAPGTDVVYDLALGIGMKLLQALCGPGFLALAVSLARGAPGDPAPHRRHFGVPVSFDATHSRIEFDARWLERPVAGSQEAVRAHLSEAARPADADGTPFSVSSRARHVAHALLMTGGMSESRIADELGMHVRTLRRRLAAEGVQARALMGEARDQFAQQLLADTRLPLVEIAQAAQYAEASSFARAFRRRVGMTPGRWRAHKGWPPQRP